MSASQLPSFIRTITVGSGVHLHRTAFGAVQVSPDPVLRLRSRSAQHSWAVPPIGNSLAQDTVQVSPCPEGPYLDVFVLIITQSRSHWKKGLPGYLCRNDALYRANRCALRLIEVTFALDAGISINDVQDAIALTDRFSWTFGKARTTGDAFFVDLHCHGNILLCENFY